MIPIVVLQALYTIRSYLFSESKPYLPNASLDKYLVNSIGWIFHKYYVIIYKYSKYSYIKNMINRTTGQVQQFGRR